MSLAQRAADYEAGQRAADLALARLAAGTSDRELLTRAVCRAMADSGRLAATPDATLAGFLDRLQAHIEGRP